MDFLRMGEINLIKNISMYLNVCPYISNFLYLYTCMNRLIRICVCNMPFVWTPHIAPFCSGRSMFNTTREQFKRFILYGVAIISVLGLKYFYCTGIKSFTSVQFYQMYSRGFINLKFYDTCSDFFYHYFYWFGFLLTVNTAPFKARGGGFWQYCLFFT